MRQGSGASVAVADTNLFIALLAGPAHALHEDALQVFRRVASGQLILIVTPIVVAELVYAAEPILGWKRTDTAGKLSRLLEADGLSVVERPVLIEALGLYGARPGLDFADAYLAATVLLGVTAVASFDRDYDAIEGVRRIAA